MSRAISCPVYCVTLKESRNTKALALTGPLYFFFGRLGLKISLF